MKKKWWRVIVGSALVLFVTALAIGNLVQAAPQFRPLQALLGTSFTYQGRLEDGGVPANGSYDLRFSLWDDSSVGSQVGSDVVKLGESVEDGLFTVDLDFGDLFDGTAMWLEVEVKGPGDPDYTALSPRQALTAVPYALQAQEAANASTLDGLDSTDFYTQAEVDALLAVYDSRITALENKLASVSTENGGQELVFTGVNVHVRSGSGATDGTINGLGNLIVGYNEDIGGDAVRTGSHNLVVGTEHSYSSYGGFVAGEVNTISGTFATVSGGSNNTASGSVSSVSGGRDNTASVICASISGGAWNDAIGRWSSVSGGRDNVAEGDASSVSGGRSNFAIGYWSSVSGGYCNDAGGLYSSVSGGYQRSASGQYDWRAGGLFEDQ